MALRALRVIKEKRELLVPPGSVEVHGTKGQVLLAQTLLQRYFPDPE